MKLLLKDEIFKVMLKLWLDTYCSEYMLCLEENSLPLCLLEIALVATGLNWLPIGNPSLVFKK